MNYVNKQQIIEERFEDYWNCLAKRSAQTFIECKLVPNEECFKSMLCAAYGMGWTESAIAREKHGNIF